MLSDVLKALFESLKPNRELDPLTLSLPFRE